MSDHSHSHEQETDDISSFDDILGMLCPQEATTVRKVLSSRGFNDTVLNSFAQQVQQDEGTEFTFSNLKAHTSALLQSEDTEMVMVVLQPLKVQITGSDFGEDSTVSIPSREQTREVRIENEVYIDRSDFRLEDSDDYFGLAPGKIVGLKYAFWVRCESVETDAAGVPVLLRCVALPDSDAADDKPKGSIQWVPASTAVPIEARLYTTPSRRTDGRTAEADWQQDVEADTLTVFSSALAEAHLSEMTSNSSKHVLFDGIGYFAPVDGSVTGEALFAQTVSLDNNNRLFATQTQRAKRPAVPTSAEMESAQNARPFSDSDLPSTNGEENGFGGSSSAGGTDLSSVSASGSMKLSMAERAELARLKAEQETQARIEEMKRVKREEMQQNNRESQRFGRLEQARQEEEQATQEKLERLRKEKMAEIVVHKRSSSNLGEDEALTPKQRQEEMRRRAEQEKQERLAEFLGKSKGDGADDDGLSSLSVKERYERAKKLQQQQEEERLESVRASISKDSRRASVRDAWSTALQQENVSGKGDDSTPTAAPASGEGQQSIRSKWAEALNEQKQTQEQRYNQTKKQTISQFRLTDGTGLVKKRIGEWEELFVELAATVEQMEMTLAAARQLSEATSWGHDIGELMRLQKEFRESANVPELFEMGSTKIYNITLLDHHIAAYIKRSLADIKTKHFALSCGVYGDQEGGKPPIDVYAAAIKTDDRTFYIALTIKPTPGCELDPRAYGVKKVAVFSKDVNQKMLERLVDIVPQKGWEGWVARGHYGDEDLCSPSSAGAVGIAAGDVEGEREGQQTAAGEGTELDGHGSTRGERDGESQHEPATEGELILKESGAAEAEGAVRSELDGEGDGEVEGPWVDVPTETAGEDVMGDILSAEDNVEGEGEVHRPSATDSSEVDEELARADAAAFADVATPRHSQSQDQAEGQAEEQRRRQGREDGNDSPFFDVDDEEEEDDEAEEDVESDVGETWKVTSTPQPKSGAPNPDAEIPRNLSADYRFNNAGHDETLRFIKGEPLPDADGDEEVEYDADEDLNATTFNSYKPSTVARVCLPKAFLPEHVSSEMLKNPNTKYSWSIDDEREEGLPPANQCSVTINLQDIQNHHCGRNILVLEGSEQCMVFTGTLKHGTSHSKYILNGNKIFEWVRGAACSGWLLKWPMQSQKFGRRMRRFFVLRDHILSYHVTRPADEEEVYSNYSLSSLHITENTTVEVGRHMFLRSLIVTTPLDKLWIRMQNGNAEETKWINCINQAIQELQRKKLFMSKVRIESKWYHESPQFNLIAVDALSYADQYIKIALFELHTPTETAALPSNVGGAVPPTRQYSVDIGTNIADGSALGMEGTPSTYSAKLVRTNESADLRSELKCVKIYGDVILIGGSNGFLGVGAMGFTSSVDSAGEPMQVMFCVPCGTSQQEVPALGSAPNSPMRNSSAENPQLSPMGRPGLHKTTSFMGAGPGYPHRKTATIISLEAAQEAHRFVAADDEGTISLWYFYKHNAISENIENLKTPRKGVRNTLRSSVAEGVSGTPGKAQRRSSVGSEKLMVRKPILKGVLSLSAIDPSGNYGNERVVRMNFLLDENQLIVSTNKRLILLILGKRGDKAASPKPQNRRASMTSPLTPNIHAFSGSGSPPATPAGEADEELTFVGWVELDRAIPGKVGLFAMHMSQHYVPLYDGASTASLQRTITQWRITEEDQAVASRFQLTTKRNTADGKKRCTVYRFEWTESMFSAALDQVKYF